MIFRQLFDAVSSTYTYVLGCESSHDAIIIDPVFEQHARDTALLRELKLQLKYSIDTHVHADHVTGSWLMKDAFGAQIVLSDVYQATGSDISPEHGLVFAFGQYSLTAKATPGHTDGCFTYVTNDKGYAFTGDCLLIRGAGRTDFQSGDVHALWRSIQNEIFSLPDNCLVYPGHDYMGRTVSTIAEEKQFNPRIGLDAREEDFAGYMRNLGLPHPKLIDIAVPANLQCGRPSKADYSHAPGWGPITLTFAGIPEIEPDWVARHLEELYLLDVRSETEFNGDQGHIEHATLIPLDQLRERIAEIETDRPIVCQSGKRSAMATQILLSAGHERVANLPGGLIHWSRLALPYLVLPDASLL
jgi:sulfur dioxygenase